LEATVTLLRKRALSKQTFEIELSRPEAFDFQPGQRVQITAGPDCRDYSLVNSPSGASLKLCIRRVEGGRMTAYLHSCPEHTSIQIRGPFGYFVFRPSNLGAVFVATGTGIAPFVSMARGGVRGFTLLHGVRSPEECYYADTLRGAATRYVACISSADDSDSAFFSGRVTDFLSRHLDPGRYDFYLCGRREMIRDVTWLVDEGFEGSKIYSEQFF
jgi:NAD(P)H-flavin reductase